MRIKRVSVRSGFYYRIPQRNFILLFCSVRIALIGETRGGVQTGYSNRTRRLTTR